VVPLFSFPCRRHKLAFVPLFERRLTPLPSTPPLDAGPFHFTYAASHYLHLLPSPEPPSMFSQNCTICNSSPSYLADSPWRHRPLLPSAPHPVISKIIFVFPFSDVPPLRRRSVSPPSFLPIVHLSRLAHFFLPAFLLVTFFASITNARYLVKFSPKLYPCYFNFSSVAPFFWN